MYKVAEATRVHLYTHISYRAYGTFLALLLLRNKDSALSIYENKDPQTHRVHGRMPTSNNRTTRNVRCNLIIRCKPRLSRLWHKKSIFLHTYRSTKPPRNCTLRMVQIKISRGFHMQLIVIHYKIVAA
jgi:hypothetical protein